MSAAGDRVPRETRRRRTEASILGAARELFAESGFERTTIRGVAGKAGVDPALVMQYYGNKEHLFACASAWSDEGTMAPGASRAEMPKALVSDMFHKFETAEEREAAIALVRNCLTHPSAAAAVRDGVLADHVRVMAEKMGGKSAELRAELIGACMMGVTMARYVLEMPHLAKADHEELARAVLPMLRALVDPPPLDDGEVVCPQTAAGEPDA